MTLTLPRSRCTVTGPWLTSSLIARTGDPLGRRVARWSIQRRERKEQAKREQTAGDANGAVTENA
jgi:hypothetical protein